MTDCRDGDASGLPPMLAGRAVSQCSASGSAGGPWKWFRKRAPCADQIVFADAQLMKCAALRMRGLGFHPLMIHLFKHGSGGRMPNRTVCPCGRPVNEGGLGFPRLTLESSSLICVFQRGDLRVERERRVRKWIGFFVTKQPHDDSA